MKNLLLFLVFFSPLFTSVNSKEKLKNVSEKITRLDDDCGSCSSTISSSSSGTCYDPYVTFTITYNAANDCGKFFAIDSWDFGGISYTVISQTTKTITVQIPTSEFFGSSSYACGSRRCLSICVTAEHRRPWMLACHFTTCGTISIGTC